jgi:glutathione peroxidase
MKKTILLLVVIFSISSVQAQQSFHNFKVKTIDGKQFDFSQLKGKKVMVVNVASKCGLTPQYKDLQKLYETYGGPRFEIVAFPANNFLSQEPGTNAEIKEFCTKNYGVTFPVMEKISVKGSDQAEIYKWLTSKSENKVLDTDVSWNFQKFLIDENGNLVKSVSPKENPMSDDVINWIKGRN